MNEPLASVMARIDARMEVNFEAVLGGMETQRATLRVMQEGIRMILERLTPGETEGPTMGELLAQLIEVVGNVDQRAKRILTRLEAIGQDLPADIVRIMNEERGPDVARVS